MDQSENKEENIIIDRIPVYSNETAQETRTFLRERFLWMFMALRGAPAKFDLLGGPTVKANLNCSDVDVLHFHVENLDTPLGQHKSALLRSTDVKRVIIEDFKPKYRCPSDEK